MQRRDLMNMYLKQPSRWLERLTLRYCLLGGAFYFYYYSLLGGFLFGTTNTYCCTYTTRRSPFAIWMLFLFARANPVLFMGLLHTIASRCLCAARKSAKLTIYHVLLVFVSIRQTTEEEKSAGRFARTFKRCYKDWDDINYTSNQLDLSINRQYSDAATWRIFN